MTITRIPEADPTGVKTNLWRVILAEAPAPDPTPTPIPFLWITGETTGADGSTTVNYISEDTGVTLTEVASITAWWTSLHRRAVIGSAGELILLVPDPDAASIAVSDDIGATWALRSSPNLNSFAMAYGQDVIMLGTSNELVYISEDLGVTWIPKAFSSPGGAYVGIRGLGHNGTDMFMLVAGNAHCHTTIDKGDTWVSSQHSFGNQFNYDRFDVAYGNGIWIVVGGGGTVSRSADNGITWLEVVTTDSLVPSATSAVYDDNSATWFVAADRFILRSQDEGLTWARDYDSGRNINFTDIAYNGIDTVVAVGYRYAQWDYTVILTTTDGGATWTEEQRPIGSPTVYSLQSIDFFTPPVTP